MLRTWHLGSPVRRLRLLSGTILLVYITTHLVDLSLCNASWHAAEAMLVVQKHVWQGPVGTALLYGALLTHAGLGLLALYERRHFRWTGPEMAQLGLGLAFPALLANHLAVTRIALTAYGLDKTYSSELATLWVLRPELGLLQVGVLLCAWVHGCLGLFFLFRLRRWFEAWKPLLLVVAVLVPVLALLGFAQGGREIARLMAAPGFARAHLSVATVGTPAQRAGLGRAREWLLIGYGSLILATLLARGSRRIREARAGLVTVRYDDGRAVRVPPGVTVLEASRLGGIGHASVCGGKGRCSTCRVLVRDAAGPLDPPAPHETALLAAIGLDPAQVRLACQLRCTANLHVSPLVSLHLADDFVIGHRAGGSGTERFVVAMFVDLRGSVALTARHAPFDSVFLLGRFIAATCDAVGEGGGRAVQFLGDGVLALFGLDRPPDEACRQALAVVAALPHALAPVAALFREQMDQAFDYGLGLHCGQAIVGEVGFGRGVAFTAMGETVNLAHRLQDLARDFATTAVVSEAVFVTAGLSGAPYPATAATVRGLRRPVPVRLLA